MEDKTKGQKEKRNKVNEKAMNEEYERKERGEEIKGKEKVKERQRTRRGKLNGSGKKRERKDRK